MSSDATEPMEPFPCNHCGACCRQVDKSPLTQSLDRGDGCCVNYDEKNRLCHIYAERPLICRVDQYYKQYFHQEMSWPQFTELNLAACKTLQSTSNGTTQS